MYVCMYVCRYVTVYVWLCMYVLYVSRTHVSKVCLHAYMFVCLYACLSRARVRVRECVCRCIWLPTSICICTCTCMYLYLHTYMHAYTHVYIYIYIYMHTCMCMSMNVYGDVSVLYLCMNTNESCYGIAGWSHILVRDKEAPLQVVMDCIVTFRREIRVAPEDGTAAAN